MKRMREFFAKQMLFGITLCGSLLLAQPAGKIVPFTDITPAQAAALIKEKGDDPLFVILDTRTPQEFAENRIRGAKSVDVKGLDFKDKIVQFDKNGTYLLYCRGGVRSARAMNLMKEWGFKTAYNLAGGLLRWQKEKLPLQGKPLQIGPK